MQGRPARALSCCLEGQGESGPEKGGDLSKVGRCVGGMANRPQTPRPRAACTALPLSQSKFLKGNLLSSTLKVVEITEKPSRALSSEHPVDFLILGVV